MNALDICWGLFLVFLPATNRNVFDEKRNNNSNILVLRILENGYLSSLGVAYFIPFSCF